jgi:UDP-2-acetamido-3-amino-2,3-dideoxy-glucuronate N-acetyltransferase
MENMMSNSLIYIHPTADVSPKATVGTGTKIWHHAQIREGVTIGNNCIIGKDVYIDFDVVVGSNVKIQNGALLYHGLIVEDGVFIGPHACMTNDVYPRAITVDGNLKTADDWTVDSIQLRYGASIGAGVVILPDLVIGRFAMVGAGSVVTKDVPDHGLVVGNPARFQGYICQCGRRLDQIGEAWFCSKCDWYFSPEDLS